jgi:hypothetical protein
VRLKEKALSLKLNARLLGLVFAIVLGVGGTLSLHGSANADPGGVLDITGNDSGGLIDLNDDGGLIDLGPNQDGGIIDVDDLTNGGGIIDTGSSNTADEGATDDADTTGNNGVLEPVTDLLDNNDTSDVLNPVTDVVEGDDASGGLIDLDDNSGLIDLGPNQDGGIIDVDDLTNGGGIIDTNGNNASDEGAVDDTDSGDTGDNNGVLEPVTDLLDNSDTGDVLNPVTDVVDGDDASGGLIDTDDNNGLIDLGPGQDGGIIDVDDFLSGGGIIDTNGNNASDEGATDDTDSGTGDNNGVLEPVTDLLDGTNPGDVLNDGADSCVGVEPLDLVLITGEGCNQPDECQSIDVNCTLDGTLGSGSELGNLLDPIIDVCETAGDTAGANAGEGCNASFGNNDEACDAALQLDCTFDDLTDVLGEDGNNSPLDLCFGLDPLNTGAQAGAGCNQDPGCGFLNLNCIVNDTLGPITGPEGVIDPLLDMCLGLGQVDLELGASCGPTSPTCPPDCGPTCPPDCGPTCPPDCGPTCPPDCGPTCPPDCGPTCPPDCSPTCPPDCGPTCPPDCGPTCPPDCGPTCPPDCGPTCPPDCGPTCPPDCGPTCPPFCVPTCPPDCGPTCPPFCVPTCPPFCGIVSPEPPESNDSPESPTGTIDADGTGTGAGGRSTGYVPALFPPPTTAQPPASPVVIRAGNFVPPTAGDGGLLGLSQERSATPVGWEFLLLVILGSGIAVRFGRKLS